MKPARNFLLAFSFLAFLALPALAQVVLIGGSTNNGNLDDTYAQEIVPGFFLPKPTIWVNEGSRAISGPYEDEMSSEPWAGPAPTPVTADGNGLPFPQSCSGPDCGVFFKPFSGNVANGAATGHLYQDLPAIPGASYVLTGWAGAEANILMGGAEIALEFLDGANAVIPGSGQVIDLLPTLNLPNGEPFSYKEYTATAVAPANAVSVRARVSMIDALANPQGGGQAYVVDDFTLTEEEAGISTIEVPTLDRNALAALALALVAAAIWVLRNR
jgi:hypothetical protein